MIKEKEETLTPSYNNYNVYASSYLAHIQTCRLLLVRILCTLGANMRNICCKEGEDRCEDWEQYTTLWQRCGD